MCEEMLFMESNGVQTKKHGRKLCLASSHSWNSWNNFHERAFGLFIEIVIPLKSIVGFVSKFKKFKFRCKIWGKIYFG
jgi:hypothetical protein